MQPSAHFASFAEFADHLDKLGLFRMRPELGKLRTVLHRLAPEKPRAVIQIAGTNGKGSTATFLASLAQAHGLRVGLFTSPHFVSFRERIRINNAPISEEQLLQGANCIMNAGGEALTYFEFVTALAAILFAGNSPEAVDIAIMETGLGGSWDAVTALDIDLIAYTPIALDHCRVLGTSITAIATDKAGAIRGKVPVYSAGQNPDALRVLREKAAASGSSFYSVKEKDSLPGSIREGEVLLGLSGEHQYGNAGLALAVWRHIADGNGWLSSEEKEIHGLAHAFIPGRMQCVPVSEKHGHPALLLDGAHNGHGIAALGKTLKTQGITPSAVIFSCLEDKSPAEMAVHLRTLATGPIFTPPIKNNPRAMAPEVLVRALGPTASPVADMAEALALAREYVAVHKAKEAAQAPERHPVLICGSLYMLGEFFTLRPDCLEKERV